jgi:hypothetical protein
VGRKCLGVALLCACLATRALAQEAAGESETPKPVIEVGGSGEQSLSGDGLYVRPTIAAQWTPIEDVLTVEGGVTPTFKSHSTEWESDLLLKKPWTVTKTFEVLAGVGPTWVHSTTRDEVHDAVGGEAAVEFAFWTSEQHRFGWYIEPAYDYVFTHDHEEAVGVTVGLLVALP